MDFVYIATPWEFHYDKAKSAMVNGCHVGVELPIATDLRHIWDLVRTSERTRKHCMLMENVCYGREELRLLKMVKDGMFGELLCGSGGYVHDLRELNFHDYYYPEEWRRLHYTQRNESHYPMHGFAPIAACMDINRGDRLDTLVSMASPALSMAAYREEHLPADHPAWEEKYISGDRNTALVTTVKGRFIRAEYSVMGPHPYSRYNSLQGTKGAYMDDPHRVYLEPEHSNHQWRPMGHYASYDHWLWQDVGGGGGGHGGMDYIMQWRTIQLMRLGLVPDIDVYDSAAWCSLVPLTGASIHRGNRPVKVPDFTRGHWEEPREGLDRGRPVEALPEPPTETTYASDHAWFYATAGWNQVRRDLSNEGNTITLNGVEYDKGLGTHAISDIQYYLAGNCSRFTADIGVDDYIPDYGSVVFRVIGDGENLFESEVMVGGDPTVSLDVNIEGVDYLNLYLGDGGDGITGDHGNWADALFHV